MFHQIKSFFQDCIKYAVFFSVAYLKWHLLIVNYWLDMSHVLQCCTLLRIRSKYRANRHPEQGSTFLASSHLLICDCCMTWWFVGFICFGFFFHLHAKCICVPFQALIRGSLYVWHNVLNCMITAKSIQGVKSAHIWQEM